MRGKGKADFRKQGEAEAPCELLPSLNKREQQAAASLACAEHKHAVVYNLALTVPMKVYTVLCSHRLEYMLNSRRQLTLLVLAVLLCKRDQLEQLQMPFQQYIL